MSFSYRISSTLHGKKLTENLNPSSAVCLLKLNVLSLLHHCLWTNLKNI